MNHTKEPWVVSSSVLVCTERAEIIASVAPCDVSGLSIPMKEAVANGNRIVSCVNALAGIDNPDEYIKRMAEGFDEYTQGLKEEFDNAIKQVNVLKDRNKKLVEVCRESLEIIQCCKPHFENTGLSCLDDCNEGIEILTKALAEKGVIK